MSDTAAVEYRLNVYAGAPNYPDGWVAGHIEAANGENVSTYEDLVVVTRQICEAMESPDTPADQVGEAGMQSLFDILIAYATHFFPPGTDLKLTDMCAAHNLLQDAEVVVGIPPVAPVSTCDLSMLSNLKPATTPEQVAANLVMASQVHDAFSAAARNLLDFNGTNRMATLRTAAASRKTETTPVTKDSLILNGHFLLLRPESELFNAPVHSSDWLETFVETYASHPDLSDGDIITSALSAAYSCRRFAEMLSPAHTVE